MSKVICLPTPTDLSLSGVEAGLDMYQESFGIEPEVLIVADTDDFFRGQEITEGGPPHRLIVARWLPPGLWILGGTHGLLYSGDI